jgi:3-methylfumaryl-CoA hydratase
MREAAVMTAASEAPTQSGESNWQDWVGRQELVEDIIGADRVAALAATLDIVEPPGLGKSLPPGWHWIFFNAFAPRRQIGADGHPKRGGFLPPIPLPRRMWAGSRITYKAPLKIGRRAARESTIKKVEVKSGRAGQLVFVTVHHRIVSQGTDCIIEEQDIVYREAAAPGASPPLTPAPDGAAWSTPFAPDPVLLFRYSALTANGHRIHYDQAYARNEEHYQDLVVHGPLTATLLQGFACELKPGAVLQNFEFRGVTPLFVSAPFTLAAAAGTEKPDELSLWARGPHGEIAMRATARYAAR